VILKELKVYFDYSEDELIDLVSINIPYRSHDKALFNKHIYSSMFFDWIIENLNKKYSLKLNKRCLENRNDLFQEVTLKNCKYSARLSLNRLYDYLLDSLDLKLKVIKKIYRLEYKGLGVYKSNYIMDQVLQDVGISKNTPPPYEDGDLSLIFIDKKRSRFKNYHKDWFFGFSSCDQIYSWFSSNTLSELSSCGVNIVEYEILESYCIESNKQSIFYKEKSNKIKEHLIYDLLQKPLQIA
jgi:hypothetical protein